MSNTDLEPVAGELVPTEHHTTLFQTNDPVEVLDHARRMADALKGALDGGGMTMRIGRSEHVLIDGWQTLGSMLGVSPYVVWSRPLENGHGWEARAEARTVDGRVVGSGEAMVTRDERNWKRADEYAIRSMAQTRAMSKALRGPLGFVVTLAGRDATPAEEAAAAPAGGDLPDWAAEIPEDALDRFGDNLAAILTAAGVDVAPHQAALGIGNALVAYCDGTVPAACARLARLLVDAINPTAPPVPDVDDDASAAAPDVPPQETSV